MVTCTKRSWNCDERDGEEGARWSPVRRGPGTVMRGMVRRGARWSPVRRGPGTVMSGMVRRGLDGHLYEEVLEL